MKKTTKRTGRKSAANISNRTPSAKAPRAGGGQSVVSRLPTVASKQAELARRKFEQGIVARGEAVEAGKPIPPGVTHEIIGYRPDGSPILRRIRYSRR